MDEAVPLLNIEQIEELTSMVRSIQTENTRKLEDILAEMVEVEQSSILVLYNMVTQQWLKKQKIVDNLCHFTLTMMSTVHMLWQKGFEQEEKMNRAEETIEDLSRELLVMGDQNESYKNRWKQTESQLNSVMGQKGRIEELYRSFSCGVFAEQGEWGCAQQYQRKCSACSEFNIQLQEQRNMLRQQSVKKIEQKQEELLSVLQEKRKLQQQFVNLKEENELARMEVELAEIAIKDALIYKASYLSMMSGVNSVLQDEPSSIKHKKDDQFILQEDMCPINSHILAGELPGDEQLELQSNYSKSRTMQNQLVDEESEYSLVRLELKEEKKTTHESPFKKKVYGTVSKQINREKQFLKDDSDQNQDELNDIVILQSSIDLTFSSAHSQNESVRSVQLQQNSQKTKRQILNSQVKDSSSSRKNEGMKKKGTRIKESNKKNSSKSQRGRDLDVTQNGLSKLYNMISSKLVTSRIKIK